MKEFFHASRDIKFLKSFLHEGVKAIGKGVGGQASGFYVYESKKLATKHFSFLKNKGIIPNSSLGGILVGIKVDENDLKYPDWQFDYESNPAVIGLLNKYAPLVEDALNKIKGIKSAKKSKRFGRFEIEYRQRGKIISKAISPADPEITDFTGIWQKTFDDLCKISFFRKEYNALMADDSHTCKKYTGKTPLPVTYLAYMQPLPNGNFKEIPLYTDKLPKEQQICPFIKTYLAQRALQKKKR